MFEREFKQRLAAVQIEFQADIFTMAFDGADADKESFGDFAAGFIFADER
jgi:hypothetical protein